MISRHNDAVLIISARELNSISRSGGIPAPFGGFYRIGDLDGNFPGYPIIFAVCYKYPPGIDARPALDILFAICAIVPCHQEPDKSASLIDDRRRIAAGISFISPNHFLLAPGSPLVR